MKIILASHNAGKIKELQALLNPAQFTVIAQADLGVQDAAETGQTFVENALIKARHAAKMTALPAIADDSGLVVPALNGAPGIYSARYAGEKAQSHDNIQKLLTELKNVPDEKRDAYFYCALVFMRHAEDPTPIICTGKWSGHILSVPQGTKGFGYDPIFYVASEHKTAAELPLTIKNRISHRGIALQLLIQQISAEIIE